MLVLYSVMENSCINVWACTTIIKVKLVPAKENLELVKVAAWTNKISMKIEFPLKVPCTFDVTKLS